MNSGIEDPGCSDTLWDDSCALRHHNIPVPSGRERNRDFDSADILVIGTTYFANGCRCGTVVLKGGPRPDHSGGLVLHTHFGSKLE